MREPVGELQGRLPLFEKDTFDQQLIGFVDKLEGLLEGLHEIESHLATTHAGDHAMTLGLTPLYPGSVMSLEKTKATRVIAEHIVHTDLPLSFDYKLACLRTAGLGEAIAPAALQVQQTTHNVGEFIKCGREWDKIESIEAHLMIMEMRTGTFLKPYLQATVSTPSGLAKRSLFD